jgi:F0F1-type ATP synthase delta subunit
MEATAIKDQFHQLIEEIRDDDYLRELFDSIAVLARQKQDVLDDLSDNDLARLDNALQQIKNGQIVPDAVVRQKYMKWTTN